jgi:hypothetical protein
MNAHASTFVIMDMAFRLDHVLFLLMTLLFLALARVVLLACSRLLAILWGLLGHTTSILDLDQRF